jgi:hypothetical protein
MRALARVFFGYVLTMLLAATSPVGTGQGAHANQLLDSLVPHVHVVNGKIVEAGQTPPVAAGEMPRPSGPALGAGSGAASAAASVMLTPPIPLEALELITDSERNPVVIGDDALPHGLAIAPPGRPPTAWA